MQKSFRDSCDAPLWAKRKANAIEQLIGFKNIQRNVDLSRELSALQDMLDEFRAQNNERAVSSHERMAQEISFLDTPARRFVLDQARTVLRELRPWWIAQHRDPKEFLELKADPVFIPMYVFFFKYSTVHTKRAKFQF